MSRALEALLKVWPIVAGVLLFSLGGWESAGVYIAGCVVLEWLDLGRQ